MTEEQLRQLFRQKIGTLTTGKDLQAVLNAMLDFLLQQVKGQTPNPDPTPTPVDTTAYKTASYATFSYA